MVVKCAYKLITSTWSKLLTASLNKLRKNKIKDSKQVNVNNFGTLQIYINIDPVLLNIFALTEVYKVLFLLLLNIHRTEIFFIQIIDLKDIYIFRHGEIYIYIFFQYEPVLNCPTNLIYLQSQM
jgi:hypothetical protein